MVMGRQTAPIGTRDDAPNDVRHGILILMRQCGLRMCQIHRAVLRALNVPGSDATREDHVLLNEIEQAIKSCLWYQVYEIVECVYAALKTKSAAEAQRFAKDVNALLRERGVGLELHGGAVEHRGDSQLYDVLANDKGLLIEGERTTALGELEEAFADIRRLPEPEVTGAIQHAVAALECLSRDLVGDNNITLGKLVKHYPHILPTTLANVVDKAYGFASDEARHLREGKEVNFAEAELVVGLSAAIISYMLRVDKRKKAKA